MALFVASLNSGSNGNCYYVGTEKDAVLIDGGISRREVEKRMKRLNLSLKNVRGIVVSHEHGDHIHGIPSLATKHNIPVYITERTMVESRMQLDKTLIHYFSTYESLQLGDLTILPFPKFHDACDPHSFVVSYASVNVGVFTDIGAPCEHLTKQFSQCHAVFLESNYDEEMLDRGRYPIFLKNRIRDGHGHLSNTQAAQLFVDHRSPFLSHLFLSHLSKNNNSPKLVHELFKGLAGRTEIVIAPRDKETSVYHIRHNPNFATEPFRVKRPRLAAQLSLFGG